MPDESCYMCRHLSLLNRCRLRGLLRALQILVIRPLSPLDLNHSFLPWGGENLATRGASLLFHLPPPPLLLSAFSSISCFFSRHHPLAVSPPSPQLWPTLVPPPSDVAGGGMGQVGRWWRQTVQGGGAVVTRRSWWRCRVGTRPCCCLNSLLRTSRVHLDSVSCLPEVRSDA